MDVQLTTSARRSRRKKSSPNDEVDFFAELNKAEKIAAKQRELLARPESQSRPDDATDELVALAVSRVRARQSFLTRREKLVLARTFLLLLALAGAVVAVWILALHGDPDAALRLLRFP